MRQNEARCAWVKIEVTCDDEKSRDQCKNDNDDIEPDAESGLIRKCKEVDGIHCTIELFLALYAHPVCLDSSRAREPFAESREDF